MKYLSLLALLPAIAIATPKSTRVTPAVYQTCVVENVTYGVVRSATTGKVVFTEMVSTTIVKKPPPATPLKKVNK